MAYSSKVGSFNIDPALTATQTQAITGLGFQPKIVLFWWGGSTGTGDSVAGGNVALGFGAATSSTNRYCNFSFSADAAATSDSASRTTNASVINVHSSVSAIDGIMDFASMDAGGFTLVVDEQFSNAYRISYMALGGTDLSNVFIGSQAIPTSTGNYNVTGVGFQPDALITFGIPNVNFDTNYSNLDLFIGMATGATAQGVVWVDSQDNVTTSNTVGYGYSGEVLAGGSSYTDYREAFVGFGADGFTLNHLEGAAALTYIYICLKGGQYKVHNLLTRADTNDIVESDVGFQPVALLFASANRALSTQNAVTANARLSIGAGTSATERAVQAISDEDNLADTETAYANYDTAVYANVVDDAIVGLMDIKSIDSSGFTAVMDDTDPSACWVTYLAIGAISSDVVVNLSSATITSGPQTITEVPGAITASLNATTVASAAQAIIPLAGDISVLLNAASIAVGPQAVSILPGDITVSLNAATLASSAQAITADAGGAGTTVDLSSASLHSSAEPILTRNPHAFDTSAIYPATLTSTDAANPVTTTYTCGAGTTVFVLMIVHASSTARAGTPTYNSINLTQADVDRYGSTGPECTVEVWYLLDPPTGSAYTVSVPNAGTLATKLAMASAIAGSGFTSTLDNAAGAGAVGTNPTTSVTAAITGDAVFAAVADGAQNFSGATASSNSIYVADLGAWGGAAQYLIKLDTGAQSMSWTFDTSEDYGIVAVSFQQAPLGRTVSLGAATLSSAAQSITVDPGTATPTIVSLNAATVTSAAQVVTASSVIPPTTVELGGATLASEAQALTAVAGEVAVSLSSVTVTASPQATTVSAEAVVVLLNAASILAEAQLTDISTLTSVGLNVVTVTSSAQTTTIAVGDVTVLLGAAGIVSDPQTVTATAVGVPPTTVLLSPASISSSAQTIVAAPGDVAVILGAATISVAPQVSSIAVGPVVALLSAPTIAAAPQQTSILTVTDVQLVTATVSAQAQVTTVSAGSVTVTLGSAIVIAMALALTAEAIAVSWSPNRGTWQDVGPESPEDRFATASVVDATSIFPPRGATSPSGDAEPNSIFPPRKGP